MRWNNDIKCGVDSDFFRYARRLREKKKKRRRGCGRRRENNVVFVVSFFFFDQFVAGAASGLAARLVTHPMDTIKSQMQVHAAATSERDTRRSFTTKRLWEKHDHQHQHQRKRFLGTTKASARSR